MSRKKEENKFTMEHKRPAFDDIKSYEEFQQYNWTRQDLIKICNDHDLLFVGSEKKLRGVIKSYFNGVKIPPRRNWYTNKVLNRFVNENGLSIFGGLVLLAVAIFLITFGIISKLQGREEQYFVLPLAFGTPLLIMAVLCIQIDKSIAVIRSIRPMSGDKKFTKEQVNAQANAKNAKNLGYEGIILAPDMLIGSSAGIAAVAYEDISSLQVKRTLHERYYNKRHLRGMDYYTYDIIVRTNRGKKVVISKSLYNAEVAVKKLYDHCLKQNPQVKFLIAEEQATPGEKVKSAIDFAVTNGALTSITVSDNLKKQLARHHILLRLDSVLGTSLVSGILIFIMSRFVTDWFTIQVIFLLILFLSLPFFTTLSLILAIRMAGKNDFDFYLGEISGWYDNGYAIKGVSNARLGFIKELKPTTEPDAGDQVILARFDDLYSLISYNLRNITK